MTLSNLARILEELEPGAAPLNLVQAPTTRLMLPGDFVAQDGDVANAARSAPRRSRGIRAIRLNDQGLRSFRVF